MTLKSLLFSLVRKRFILRNSNYLLESKVKKSYKSYEKDREEHFITHLRVCSGELYIAISSFFCLYKRVACKYILLIL